MIERPDVLVLGAGGIAGEAWMSGLLGGLGVDFRGCEYFVGTSAGSIVAATLAAGHEPRAVEAPDDERVEAEAEAAARAEGREADAEGESPSAKGGEGGESAAAAAAHRIAGAARFAGRVGAAAATPFAPGVLAVRTPAARVARAAALRFGPAPKRTLGQLHAHIEELGASFDGRLRIAAVDRATGRRVMFGAPGAPEASVADAVLASCAVPWVFEPATIGGRQYVDGGVWSPTNLDAAPAGRGSRVLCLMPTAGAARAYRAGTRAAAGAETLALRARGATVTTIAPDPPFEGSLLDPRSRAAAERLGFAQGRRIAQLP